MCIECPWNKKLHGLVGSVSHSNHRLVWIALNTGKTIATKKEYLREPGALDRLADVI